MSPRECREVSAASPSHTHVQQERQIWTDLDQTLCRGPFRPKLLHDSVNTTVRKHLPGTAMIKILLVTTNRNTCHSCGNIYSQCRTEKGNWPCQRCHILAPMKKSNHQGKRNQEQEKECIFHKNAHLIWKKRKATSQCTCPQEKKIKPHSGF